MPKWLKISLKVFGSFVAVVLILLLCATLYISYNKDKVLKLVNAELTKNINGTVTIGDMKPQFFKGFPNISLGLENVLIRDKRYPQHHHTLLDAKNFDVSINVKLLMKGAIAINHADISNAAIDVYTDSSGYSNTSAFKKDSLKKPDSTKKNKGSTRLERFSFSNISLKIDDQKAKKLFNFIVNDLSGNITYPDSGWHASFHLDVMPKSMTFSTTHGSFIKNKNVEGDLEAGYNKATGRISVTADALDIGDDPFKVNTAFETGKKPATFAIHVAADKILWRSASAMVSPNIQLKLNQFNISNPIAVTALISGTFSGGDPYLYITAKVRDNTVTIPGSTINSCSFNGVFTNNYIKGKGYTDDNSVIRLIHMNGLYNTLPFTIDTGSIVNLNKPIATGNFKSTFAVANLNKMLGGGVAKFTSGTASIRLRYSADIVDYRINKPFVAGSINLKNADIIYKPDNLTLKNTSVTLNFVGKDLLMRNIRLQTGQSIVTMNGRIRNFLNLYYNAPEKILLNLDINSDNFFLGEFIGFLGNNHKEEAVSNVANSGNVIKQLNTVLQKGNAAIRLNVAKAHYIKFLATDLHAELQTTSEGLIVKSVGLKNSGGTLNLNGYVKRGNGLNRLSLNTTISDVNVREFFYAFDNFGLKDFTYENLRGTLSAKTQITAGINNKGTVEPKSINGAVSINLKNGALLNFKPLLGVAKIAFPFRNLKNIGIPNLDGDFTIRGDKIDISPMKISSSALNLDVAGTYGLNNGTNITLDVPLRNPKNDTTITDAAKLEKKRYRGIVLHLLAKSDETGKVKIGFNKGRKDE